jgi:hypothetical protein
VAGCSRLVENGLGASGLGRGAGQQHADGGDRVGVDGLAVAGHQLVDLGQRPVLAPQASGEAAPKPAEFSADASMEFGQQAFGV